MNELLIFGECERIILLWNVCIQVGMLELYCFKTCYKLEPVSTVHITGLRVGRECRSCRVVEVSLSESNLRKKRITQARRQNLGGGGP